MAKLTSNQQEALHACVKGNLGGRLLEATVPSLIKRGLMSMMVEEKPVLYRGGDRRPFQNDPRAPLPTYKEAVYRLTQEGHDAYVKMRTKWHTGQIESLTKEFESDLRSAEWRTRPMGE